MARIDSIISSLKKGWHPPTLIMSEQDALILVNSLSGTDLSSIDSVYSENIPWVFLYEKEEGKKELSISIVRKLISDISLGSYSKLAIYILRDIDQCSLAAMNALLKILEDIPKWILIIGTATKQESLIETIRSRSIIISLNNTEYTPLSTELQEAIKHYIEWSIVDLLIILYKEKFSRETSLSLLEYYFDNGKAWLQGSKLIRFEESIEAILLSNEPTRNILDNFFLPKI